MKHIHEILLKPLVTEKGMIAREKFSQFFFAVNVAANKVEIRKAVEKAFSVKVLDVQTMRLEGKKKRRGRMVGKRVDWKKAVVRLAPGESIKYFEGA